MPVNEKSIEFGEGLTGSQLAGEMLRAKLPVMNPESDSQIIADVLSGNTDSFALLVERYQRLVFSVAARHVPYANVQELAHETFIAAYRDLSRLRDRSKFKAWLTALAVRRSYDFWRTRNRSKELPLSALSETQLDWVENALQEQSASGYKIGSAAREAGEILHLLFGRLSAEDRMIVTLIHIEERTVREAAELLGWSSANVKIRAFRARNKMRKLLENILNEENQE